MKGDRIGRWTKWLTISGLILTLGGLSTISLKGYLFPNDIGSDVMKSITHIGGEPLGTQLSLPVDARLVGLSITSDGQGRGRWDVAYIFKTDIDLKVLRDTYRKNFIGKNVKWIVDTSDTLSFTVFRGDSTGSCSSQVIYSVSAFRGISESEGEVLGLLPREYREKVFIYFLVDEPTLDRVAEEGGGITLPILVR
ncbi:MAG: hypothetical protein WHS44_05120 [Fimbriimonadales bacterium]|nr:MAG: hypothetical protein KatS3mg018_2547 [Fimbriimonadales bacterium]